MTDTEDYAEFYSNMGQTVLSMRSVTRKGNQLVMTGKLMGAWESEIYIPPQSVLKTIGKLLKPSIIWFVLSIPFIKKDHKE